ncbi:hypothetical protein WMF20_15620 [Sorangium sp. So ce834]|uniref:hypothetical protein n=1 Tax=Sorangium sp. So ce834 TaxID=3133321 RepID=UPI003F5F2AC8
MAHGLAGWLALIAASWIRHWTTNAAGPIPTAPWVAGALVATAIAVYARNLAQSPGRLAFAALRTAAHLLFGMGAPAAALLMALLAAPHGMSALPRLGLPLLALWTAAIVGHVLLWFIIVPRDSTQTAPDRPNATS